MPYTNIVWIKLKLDLFDEDNRFLYKLNDRQQLLYIKLLYLAGRTRNHIPKDFDFIKDKIRYYFGKDEFFDDIEVIKTHYKKFVECEDFYKFIKFDELHNLITNKETQRNSEGTPKGSSREEKRRKEKSRVVPKLSDSQFLDALKKNYDFVDFDSEMKKVDTWLLANPGRQKTRRFLVNWFNKIDRPLNTQQESKGTKLQAASMECTVCSGTGWEWNQAANASKICKCRYKNKEEYK